MGQGTVYYLSISQIGVDLLVPSSEQIQWFPGHMAKTIRELKKDVKLVDAVAEIVDARIPMSSRNPQVNYILAGKPRILLLNKSSLADEQQTGRWLHYFKMKETETLAVDSKNGRGIDRFYDGLISSLRQTIGEDKASVISRRMPRIMVVGIPNVGKSSFINKILRVGKAKVENRPGVTRGKQWFTIDHRFELLDTPGILWPKIENKKSGIYLALTGAIKDQVVDTQELAIFLLMSLKTDHRKCLQSRFHLEEDELDNTDGTKLLGLIAKKRGMLLSGGNLDIERAATMLVNEFRDGRLGRITLEKVGD